MPTFLTGDSAFGSPGLEPRWTHGDKDGMGTAYSGSSRLWFTIWNGIVTELYYPTVDRPQIRDFQFLLSDGESFTHSETRDLQTEIRRVDDVLAYEVDAKDPDGRYGFTKVILSDPHQSCLLVHTRVHGEADLLKRLNLYVLCAPHLDSGGAHNSGYVLEVTGGARVLVAQRDDTWMAIAANHPFSRASAGFVGTSDGYTDLADGFKMRWQFSRAEDGNIALTGEIPLSETDEFTVGVAFGETLEHALSVLFQALAMPFEQLRKRYAEQWLRATDSLRDLSKASSDGGDLYGASCQVLLAHEDKVYQGAIIASLAIPWGHTRGDKEGAGGYHLVWPRDMVQSAIALLAIGNRETPLRSLIYLATAQQSNGRFAQNFWIDGTPLWMGVQLDEAAFPILLAYRLWKEDALAGFDPLPMMVSAASYLLRHGPVTGQDRWEENSGYSPSTLAVCIAAVIAAAAYVRFRGDSPTAEFLELYADYLEANVEHWTVTRESDLVAGVTSHYVRLNPVERGHVAEPGALERVLVTLTSQPPGSPYEFPARAIVDAGFLELVRYGVRSPHDPLIEGSLRVVDELLKVVTPSGTCWRRYPHDGYGQREDGNPYEGYGVGRAWPLLAGERGHYEIAAGRSAGENIRSMEGFATPTHLLPEQVWDEPDRPEYQHLRCGRPTGSATPLLWTHAEYIKLLRSSADGQVYERVAEVEARYLSEAFVRPHRVMWSFHHPVEFRRKGESLRLIAEAPFELHWSTDAWSSKRVSESTATKLGTYYVDLVDDLPPEASVWFTFNWHEARRWEGSTFCIRVTDRP